MKLPDTIVPVGKNTRICVRRELRNGGIWYVIRPEAKMLFWWVCLQWKPAAYPGAAWAMQRANSLAKEMARGNFDKIAAL